MSWALFNHNYSKLSVDNAGLGLPQCQPYTCNAVEVSILSNAGWPMNDAEISLTPPADGFYRGGGNGLELQLPAQLGFGPQLTPDWDATQWHDVTGFTDPPDYCITGAKFNTVITPAFGSTRCVLIGAEPLTETLNPDFSSTHILVGGNDGSVLIESTSKYSTGHQLNMRASCAVGATSLVLGWQAETGFFTIDLGTPAFDIDKPYVITTRVHSAFRVESGVGFFWDEGVEWKIDGFGGSHTHSFTDTDGAFSGSPVPVSGGFVNLFRGSAAGVNSLGVLFGDHHDDTWLAVQRNYSDYILPPECT